MKKIFTASVLAITGVFCINANAATATGNFNVAVSLQSACLIGTIPAIPISYTSFQSAAVDANVSFTVKCTNTQGYSLSINAGTGAASGITYLLSLGTAAATGITAASLSLASQTGSGANQSFVISATAAGGQGGTTASSTPVAVNDARVLTVSY